MTKLFRKIFPSFDVPKEIILEEKADEKYGWFSTNLQWSELHNLSAGYSNNKILQKCCDSLLLVKNGAAAYERDSVIFDKIEYSWPIVSAIMLAAATSAEELDLIDFGGSLGSSFYQNRKFLSHLKKVRWSVVEQQNFVECGNQYFADEELKFYSKISDCKNHSQPNIILFSSSIQYLESPYDFLDEVLALGIEFLVFDLTGFHNEGRDILTLQKVWPHIYEARYPCWFFNKEKFFAKILTKYDLVEEFISHLGEEIKIDGKAQAHYLGAIFRIKNHD